MESLPRILWFCTTPLSDVDAGSTGTWLGAMARGLMASKEVELGIIALDGAAKHLIRCDYQNVNQWLVPARQTAGRNGLPHSQLVSQIVEASKAFNPDLVHIWGTEWYWGLLTTRNMIEKPSILTLQGVKYRIAPHVHAGMTDSERRACYGLKEVVKYLMKKDRKHFLQEGEPFEREIMRGHRWAICQTPWQESQVWSNQPKAELFHLDLPLRQAFYVAEPWAGYSDNVRLFCSSAYGGPAKGLHVAVRALAILKRQNPKIKLRIAGARPGKGIRRDGYMHWLAKEIKNMGIEDNICWLGSLPAEKIAEELRLAAAVIIPSFAESYCMAFAEAMWIGVPTVTTYTGGTAYLGRDEETCLFFPTGDEAMCAYQLQRILKDRELASRLGAGSRELAVQRHDPGIIIKQQLHIYHQVLLGSKGLNSGVGKC